LSDGELYLRSTETLLASWEEYARGAVGAELQRLDGVAAAVFRDEPERGVYNNALLERDLAAARRAAAIDAMEAAYTEARISRFAAWVHERETPLRRDLERRGYTVDTTTRAMGIRLARLRVRRPRIELAPPDWFAYLRIIGVPPSFLCAADRDAYHLLVAGLDGEAVATAMAFDFDGDCGIYNVGTLDHARRRGLGTALTELHVHDALDRGCTTASLQSTPMAEGIYRRLGFRDLGRIIEYVPPRARSQNGRPVRQTVSDPL
jgi:ribosomal protein S18 acetylase RimI-like enzyme